MNKTGSSTLEFIFCAPLLLIVMFVAMELNERIEQRVTATMASANSAWLADPRFPGRSPDAAELLVKADILGTKSTSSPEMVGPGQVQAMLETDAVLSYSETKRRADAYVAKLDRFTGAAAETVVRRRAMAEIGTTRIDGPGQRVAAIAVEASKAVSKITHPEIDWLPKLFPESMTEEQILSWSVSRSGTTNAALDAIRKLSETINKSDTSADLDRFGSPEYKVLAAKVAFLKRDPAFHPDAYENQSLYGFALSMTAPKYSGSFADFVKDCFMKFAKEPCNQKNGFYSYVENIHGTVFGIKTMIDTAKMLACAFGPVTCIPAEFSKQVVENAISEMVRILESEVEKKVAEAIEKVIHEKMEKIGRSTVEDLKRTIDDFPTAVANKIEGEMKKSVDQVLNYKDSASGNPSTN